MKKKRNERNLDTLSNSLIELNNIEAERLTGGISTTAKKLIAHEVSHIKKGGIIYPVIVRFD